MARTLLTDLACSSASGRCRPRSPPAMLGDPLPSAAFDGNGITQGDINILRFLAAIEILEADLWQQYNELGGIQDSEVPGGSGSKVYTDALLTLDGDMSQYIHDNTEG